MDMMKADLAVRCTVIHLDCSDLLWGDVGKSGYERSRTYIVQGKDFLVYQSQVRHSPRSYCANFITIHYPRKGTTFDKDFCVYPYCFKAPWWRTFDIAFSITPATNVILSQPLPSVLGAIFRSTELGCNWAVSSCLQRWRFNFGSL